ncbi:VOC family protein [uncultured Modestobacter sp.]|uniref:VOC family protein n=1 Tax=uncultured Modestobacter sp. TaxID=380048 RepID=UPI0026184557|nr:VOC family protein [uncultured Modestobacter sp.]
MNGLAHVNQLVDDIDAAESFYTDVLGARTFWRQYDQDENRDACLFLVGDVCIELFAPRDEHSLLGAALARYGNSWHSFEWHVPDLDEARVALVERGVRIPVDRPGAFLMTHPADCHGMLLELSPLTMPGDPRAEPGWGPASWRDRDPLGITGLHRVTVAVRDLTAATGWLTGLLGVPAPAAEHRRELDADVVSVPVADHVVELVQARQDTGPIADHVRRWGQRLRSIELGVTDLDRATGHLRGRGLRVEPGSRAGAVAIAAADNWGVRWELAAG